MPDNRRKLTPNFWLHELTVSQQAERFGLDNTPGPAVLPNLLRTATALETVRAALGHGRILVSRAFSSPAVNAKVGGVKESAHLLGLAADFTAPDYGTPLEACYAIRLIPVETLPFDQLIFEGSWVHLGLAIEGRHPRREVLTAHFRKGSKPTYTHGLP